MFATSCGNQQEKAVESQPVETFVAPTQEVAAINKNVTINPADYAGKVTYFILPFQPTSVEAIGNEKDFSKPVIMKFSNGKDVINVTITNFKTWKKPVANSKKSWISGETGKPNTQSYKYWEAAFTYDGEKIKPSTFKNKIANRDESNSSMAVKL